MALVTPLQLQYSPCTICGRSPFDVQCVLHPQLKVLVCVGCHSRYYEGDFRPSDDDGNDDYCRWCAEGGTLLACDRCRFSFCVDCIQRTLGADGVAVVENIKSLPRWACVCCEPPRAIRTLQRMAQNALADARVRKVGAIPPVMRTCLPGPSPNDKGYEVPALRANTVTALNYRVGLNGCLERIVDADMSNGKEKFPVPVINDVDSDVDFVPPGFKYITKKLNNTPFDIRPNIHELHPQLPTQALPSASAATDSRGSGNVAVWCDCKGATCSSNCCCRLRNGDKVVYNPDGTVRPTGLPIFECNYMCSCGPDCRNRVIQKGLQLPLEIFKTEDRGWGVRCRVDVPEDTFICEYIAEMITGEEANARKGRDVYMFGVDFEDQDEIQRCLSGEEAAAGKAARARKPGRRQAKTDAPSDAESAAQPTQPSVEQLSLSQSSDVSQDCSEEIVLDAHMYGNLARFINHSCTPNLFKYNVYVDCIDSRAVHVCFFAAEFIPAMTELTYDYGYKQGSVENRTLQCRCGSKNCRKDLL